MLLLFRANRNPGLSTWLLIGWDIFNFFPELPQLRSKDLTEMAPLGVLEKYRYML